MHNKMKYLKLALLPALLFSCLCHGREVPVAHSDYWEKREGFTIGLYNTNQFMMHTNCESNCNRSAHADWYFKNEPRLIPKKLHFTLPPLIWVGSGEVVLSTRIHLETTEFTPSTLFKYEPYWAQTDKLQLTEKIASNKSYFDATSVAFFKDKRVKLRGQEGKNSFVARTVWPIDFKINLNSPLKSLDTNESLQSLVQHEKGGAQSAFESRLIWAKNQFLKDKWVMADSTVAVGEKPVLAIMLNGAQGDDDEAHGGHFALATGRIGLEGDMSNWLVNNYYNLASNSEKGIIAAPTPLDNYMADLNSGQSYYRPSYMLVAVFNQDRVPAQFQAATNRVYQHLYRNDFVYDHSRDNCAGISIDTLRNLGWNIPERGVESHLKAIGAYFFVAAKELSLTKGRAIYDYLSTEKTRLYPAQTFDAMGEDLLNRLLNPASKTLQNGALETQIKEDIEAIYFVRIPQIPSSRAFGRAPVYGFDEYMSRVPADPKDWKTAPATPNPFPEALKDGLALKLEKPSLVPLPVAIVFTLLLYGLVALFRKIWHLKTVKYSNNIK